MSCVRGNHRPMRRTVWQKVLPCKSKSLWRGCQVMFLLRCVGQCSHRLVALLVAGNAGMFQFPSITPAILRAHFLSPPLLLCYCGESSNQHLGSSKSRFNKK